MEKNIKKIRTDFLAFLDYYDKDNIRQFSIFACEGRSPQGKLYYRDIDSAVVYTLANDNGERMQDSPVLIDNYNKRAIRLGENDLLFKAESSGSTAGDFEYPSHEEYATRFQILAKDMKFRDSWKYAIIAGKLRDKEIDEDDLTSLVRAVNKNERRLSVEGKARRTESFKHILGDNVQKMINDMSIGLATLDENYLNNNGDEMGE